MKKKVTIVVAVVVVLLLIYFLRRCYKHSVRVRYFFNPGCPHCRNFMAEWNQFEAQASGRADIQKINCATDPSACAGIRGVPHVVFSTDVGDTVYPGDRTAAALSNYLDRVSS